MLAAIATVAFLSTLWLIGVVCARMLSESSGKIVAALKGQSMLAAAEAPPPIAVRVSLRSRPQPALRAQPQWRAAA